MEVNDRRSPEDLECSMRNSVVAFRNVGNICMELRNDDGFGKADCTNSLNQLAILHTQICRWAVPTKIKQTLGQTDTRKLSDPGKSDKQRWFHPKLQSQVCWTVVVEATGQCCFSRQGSQHRVGSGSER